MQTSATAPTIIPNPKPDLVQINCSPTPSPSTPATLKNVTSDNGGIGQQLELLHSWVGI